jgi:hypothetical protein
MHGVDRHECLQRAPPPLDIRLTHHYRHEYAGKDRKNESTTQTGKEAAAGHETPQDGARMNYWETGGKASYSNLAAAQLQKSE